MKYKAKIRIILRFRILFYHFSDFCKQLLGGMSMSPHAVARFIITQKTTSGLQTDIRAAYRAWQDIYIHQSSQRMLVLDSAAAFLDLQSRQRHEKKCLIASLKVAYLGMAKHASEHAQQRSQPGTADNQRLA